MPDSSLSRRRFVGLAGGVAVWFAAAPSHSHVVSDTPMHRAERYGILTAEQAATFDAFASQVIPSEPGSPGAREAKVTHFADNGLASFAKDQRPDFGKALAALDAGAGATGFASLTPARQVEVMREFERTNRGAFETLRAPVIAGMFANPSYGGNAGKVGWKLIGFEDRFSWQAPFGYYDQLAEAKRRE
ncbi:MAG: gluconate 2-dehydrogenase subunit 3 family protein [Gemmatimonadaceae bacterium]